VAASDTLFTRIEMRIKSELEQLCKNPSPALREKLDGKKLTERLVIERSLKYLFQLPEDMRNAIMSEEEPSLALIGQVLEDMSWCEHAFRNEFWHWAFKEYWHLYDKYDATGIRRGCSYYESYSCMGMHDDLVADGLEEIEMILSGGKSRLDSPWEKIIKAADHSLHLAIHFCGENEEQGGKHPVVPYNIACSFSRRCELLIIETLAAQVIRNPPERAIAKRQAPKQESEYKKTAKDYINDIINLKKEIDVNNNDTSRKNMIIFWENLARNWKTIPDIKVEPTEEMIFRYTTRAMEKLKQIDTMKELDSPYNPNFLVRRAAGDRDLAFVRNDQSSETAFRNWADSHDKKSRLDDFVELMGELPSNLQPEWLTISPVKSKKGEGRTRYL
jgi:hypothetical protein